MRGTPLNVSCGARKKSRSFQHTCQVKFWISQQIPHQFPPRLLLIPITGYRTREPYQLVNVTEVHRRTGLFAFAAGAVLFFFFCQAVMEWGTLTNKLPLVGSSR